jgi:hypothetical protein
VLAAAFACTPHVSAALASLPGFDPPQTVRVDMSVFAPPGDGGPVVVWTSFVFHDINDIDDEAETVEFTGVLTLTWRDPRQAFDPVEANAKEKIYTGNFQFNEISPGWYPQVVLVNAAGLYQSSGVLLRVQPDGSSTLVQTLNAVAEVDFDLRRFPFDGQRLDLVFEVLGFDRDEVLMELRPGDPPMLEGGMQVPQWSIRGASASVRDRPAPYAGVQGVSSAFVASVIAARQPIYVIRLVVLPLIVIVLLSFAVFWMDRSTLGDRIAVSFIGILTAVSYMFLISGTIPRISYFTLIHGFTNLSFLTMCATVVINLLVGAMDKRGRQAAGDRVDLRCRWIFPLTYFGLLLAMTSMAFLFF